MSKLIQELNATVQNAKEVQANLESLKQKEKQKKAKSDSKLGVERATNEIPEILQKIKERAASGKRSYSISVTEFNDSRSLNEYLASYAEELIRYFKSEGLKVASEWDTYEPSGSDPYYPYRAYHYSINLNW